MAYFDIRNELFINLTVDRTAEFYQDFSRTWLIFGVTRHSKWLEPRSISSSYSVIVRVRVVPKRTVGGG